MKLIHLSDLHLGKRVNEVPMLEDQRYILQQILSIIDAEQPQAVLIAGDVYDRSVPPAEAVEVLDEFLFQLVRRDLQVLICSGNHDSAERLSFGGRMMAAKGIHISPVYDGQILPISLGEVDVYLMPFLKATQVRRFFPDAEIETDTDALRAVIGQMPKAPGRKKVLVAHQFVTGGEGCDSEELSVGYSGQVEASVFEDFDYVALGHLHGPQNIAENRIRYCGTPLKYSFSEASHKKSVTVVEIGQAVQVRTVPLTPLRDLREIRGTYEALTAKACWENTPREDYLHIILTDEEDVPEAIGRLQVIYPNLMKLSYDNTRTRNQQNIGSVQDIQCKSPLDLFQELYELQNNQPMTEAQAEFARELIESIWEDTK